MERRPSKRVHLVAGVKPQRLHTNFTILANSHLRDGLLLLELLNEIILSTLVQQFNRLIKATVKQNVW